MIMLEGRLFIGTVEAKPLLDFHSWQVSDMLLSIVQLEIKSSLQSQEIKDRNLSICVESKICCKQYQI